MFRNYYKTLNISSKADDKEIYSAYEKSELHPILLDEIKMVLMNKSLKTMYDAEVEKYELSESKQKYEISNAVLDREIKKIKMYAYNKSQMLPYENKDDKTTRIVKFLWSLTLTILLYGLVNGIFSYYRGVRMEERRQKWMNSYYVKPANSSVANVTAIPKQTYAKS